MHALLNRIETVCSACGQLAFEQPQHSSRVYIGVTQSLYRDNGKEHGNYYNGLKRDYFEATRPQ